MGNHRLSGWWRRGALILATGLGSGFSPFAPGTAGSLVGLAFFWPLSHLAPFHQVVTTLLLFGLGVPACTEASRYAGRKDPGIAVVDEIVGMWVTLLFLPLTPLTAAVGFVAFRAMDVVKPYPARQLEQLPGGWGIMADDVMAGVYANLLLRVGLLVWSQP